MARKCDQYSGPDPESPRCHICHIKPLKFRPGAAFCSRSCHPNAWDARLNGKLVSRAG